MLRNATLKNFGPISNLSWGGLGKINLVIGANSTGKTFLLKALYSAIRTLEQHTGSQPRKKSDILFERLYWTFQTTKIGDLVTKSQPDQLKCEIQFDCGAFRYQFGKDTLKQVQNTNIQADREDTSSIFLPAKEVLSLHDIILRSRDIDQEFGFDDTYLDLARALSLPTSAGKNYYVFADSRKALNDMFGGRVRFNKSEKTWVFEKDRNQFSIGQTAEGIKKIAILDTLLGNRYLNDRSIVFIDEPESALHPQAISTLLDIVASMAELGIQFFMATHSYFVIKKLALIAYSKDMSIPLISLQDGSGAEYNLKNGMPDNPIIEESINLHNQSVNAAFIKEN